MYVYVLHVCSVAIQSANIQNTLHTRSCMGGFNYRKQRRGAAGQQAAKLQPVDSAWLAPTGSTAGVTGRSSGGERGSAGAGRSSAGGRGSAAAGRGSAAVMGGTVVDMPDAWKQWKLDTASVIKAMGGRA